VSRLALDNLSRSRGWFAAWFCMIENVEPVQNRCEGVAELVREHGKEIGLSPIGVARELDLTIRQGL
jgi:hypothetical protein